jgi:hypothetical protein
MSNSTLFTVGSIHQGHELFSEVSRDRQCCFMRFSALLCAQSFQVQQWTTETIEMYLNALKNQLIPDTETLSLNYQPVVSTCADILVVY